MEYECLSLRLESPCPWSKISQGGREFIARHMTNLREVSMQMELPQENIEIMDDIFRAMFMEVFMLNVPRSMNILLHV